MVTCDKLLKVVFILIFLGPKPNRKLMGPVEEPHKQGCKAKEEGGAAGSY